MRFNLGKTAFCETAPQAPGKPKECTEGAGALNKKMTPTRETERASNIISITPTPSAPARRPATAAPPTARQARTGGGQCDATRVGNRDETNSPSPRRALLDAAAPAVPGLVQVQCPLLRRSCSRPPPPCDMSQGLHYGEERAVYQAYLPFNSIDFRPEIRRSNRIDRLHRYIIHEAVSPGPGGSEGTRTPAGRGTPTAPRVTTTCAGHH
eukprot:gene23393-biopygen19337